MQVRRDVYNHMCSGGSYDDLLVYSDSKNGYVFETITQIVHLHKLLPVQFHYQTIYKGYEKDRVVVKHVDEILNLRIGQGGDAADITWSCGNHINCTSVKFRDCFSVGERGISEMSHHKDVRFSYVCKDKTNLLSAVKRSHHKDTRPVAPIFMEMISNDMVLDEQDIKAAYQRFQNSKLTLEDVQEHYLCNKRKPLQLYLHQLMHFNKFRENWRHKLHLLAHDPRTGKSITLMRCAVDKLKSGLVKRVLVVTPVVSTIQSFSETVRDYKEFASIGEPYLIRNLKQMPPPEWTGVAIASIQYFKTVGQSKSADSFDMIISDEAHIGSDTELSREKLFDPSRSSLRYLIFASGTPCDTAKAFNIPASCQYHWNSVDSHMMKRPAENRGRLKSRHGDVFVHALEMSSCSKDYSHVPGQVYLRSTFDAKLLDDFNAKHPCDKPLGISWSAILALKNPQTGEGGFVLEGYSDGVDFMKDMLRSLLPDDRNTPSTYRRCEKVRNQHSSRTFTGPDDFELVLMFLPTHSNDANIAPLQRTLVDFMGLHGVWRKWHVAFDNASTSMCVEHETAVARDNGKHKMVLLLGDKNTVGVTYHNCDLSIHLDNTKSLAAHTQKMARAATPGPGKSIYITADMHLQRNFNVIRSKVKGAQKGMQTDTPEEAYESLYESGTFLVDPDEALGTEEAYRSMMAEMRAHVTEEKDILDLLEDPTDDVLSSILKGEHKFHGTTYNGEDMEGDANLANGERDALRKETGDMAPDRIPDDEVKDQVNRTLGLMKTKVMPLNGILCHREAKRNAVCDSAVFVTDVLPILMALDKGIKFSHHTIVMKTINTFRDENMDLVERIEDMYLASDLNTIRRKVAEHFIPSHEERVNSGEVPTPPDLVDAMLSKMPSIFWSTPQRVLEPCCGKGNFVLGLFQKFDEGLKDKFPDTRARHKVIVEECIYFTDIIVLNVLVTRELLRCASGGVASFYNSRDGDTLQMNWTEPFDAVIGNPPYNAHKTLASGNSLWQKFTVSALTVWTSAKGYVCFVHPPGWRKPVNERSKFNGLFRLMAHDNHMEYLEINDAATGMKVFKAGTRYDWYVIRRGMRGLTEIDGVNYDLRNFMFLPNSGIADLVPLLGDGCGLLYSTTYDPRKAWVSREQGGDFIYPLVHATSKSGVRCCYSSVNDRGFFGVAKVIFGDSGINNPIIDMLGVYGMTQHAMAIPVVDEDDAQQLVGFLTGANFTAILKSCLWSNYQIDWMLFKHFRPGFWRS
jgi:hypothetical protein